MVVYEQPQRLDVVGPFGVVDSGAWFTLGTRCAFNLSRGLSCCCFGLVVNIVSSFLDPVRL